ncbi:MAG: hypothetical protein ACE5JG_10465, partial [Planctomycetota bacterium]
MSVSAPRLLAPRIYFGVSAGFALLFVGAAVWGWDYYRLASLDRPHHPGHAVFRSSGRVGLVLGVAGTALILLNLTYVARKWLLRFRWLGSRRAWMAFHITTGLVGPALIVLHSAFLPRSTLGTTAFAGMGVV